MSSQLYFPITHISSAMKADVPITVKVTIPTMNTALYCLWVTVTVGTLITGGWKTGCFEVYNNFGLFSIMGLM